jgi:CxxC motif-containing protein (DUF1111 family)
MIRNWVSSVPVLLTCLITVAQTNSGFAEDSSPRRSRDAAGAAIGREIFLREWLPDDPRSHGGDGLGPVFNDTSCVSCHNQGGVGGGGSDAKNVVVITAVRVQANRPATQAPQTTVAPGPNRVPQQAPPVAPKPTIVQQVFSSKTLSPEEQERKLLLEELRSIHPGLVTARSVVLHKSGTDAKYAAWRDRALGFDLAAITTNQQQQFFPLNPQQTPPGGTQPDFFTSLVAQTQQNALAELQPPNELMAERLRSQLGRLGLGLGPGNAGRPQIRGNVNHGTGPQVLAPIVTQRNSIALFGVGLIDSIPDQVIEANAAESREDFPEVSGRVARLKNGQIGRFGWKAQKGTLHDFTMTACAVELGLHVPDHPQAGVPHKPGYRPTGFDLDQQECNELVHFLKELPPPGRASSVNSAIGEELREGELVFAKIGCAACHVADLGEVHGIYSDLLVHDMGSDLGDSGSYSSFQPQSSGKDAEDPLAGLMPFDSPPGTRSPAGGLQSAGPFGPNGQPTAVGTEEEIPDKMIGAARQEWRTPPLWGVRDSAPYMHDGRASTLEQAISFHGGEGQLSANRFFRLPAADRARLLTFLRSLVAPE